MLFKKNKLKWIEKLPKHEKELYGFYLREVTLRKNVDLSYILTLGENERKEGELDIKQSFFIDHLVADKIKKWATDFCEINHIDSLTSPDRSAIITVYYNNIVDVKRYQDNGVSEKIKEQFLEYLEEEGYFKCFPNGQYEWFGQKRDYVVIEFDSWERIKKECQGIYQWRYR